MAEENITNTGVESGAENAAPATEPMSFDDFLKSNPEYQREFDRRVSKGITTAVGNERARLEVLHNEQLTEVERVAKMTEAEKSAYFEKKRAKELREREEAITKRELTATAKEMLVEKGLPISLASIVSYKDMDSCKASIEAIEAAFNSSVQTSVETRLRGGKPPKDAQTEGASQDFDKMSDAEFYAAMKRK